MLSLFGMVSRMKVCLTCIKDVDLFKVFVCFVPFESTIWEIMFYFFQASRQQIQET